MNHCTGAPAELWLERYIQGTLPDSEAQQLEEHYFDCPVCLAQVEALQAVHARLGQLTATESPVQQSPVQQPPVQQPPAKKRAVVISWPTAAAALLALAASLLIVFLGERFLLPRVLPAINSASTELNRSRNPPPFDWLLTRPSGSRSSSSPIYSCPARSRIGTV